MEYRCSNNQEIKKEGTQIGKRNDTIIGRSNQETKKKEQLKEMNETMDGQNRSILPLLVSRYGQFASSYSVTPVRPKNCNKTNIIKQYSNTKEKGEKG